MATSVHELCQERRMTIDQLCQQSGLESTRVQAIFLGRWTPSPDERSKIAAALDVEVEQIAWGHKTPIQHIYGHGPS